MAIKVSQQEIQTTKALVTKTVNEDAAKSIALMRTSVGAYEMTILNALSRDPLLAKCTPGSLRLAIRQCAQFGFLPDGKAAAIVPIRNNKQNTIEAHFWLMIQGILTKIRESVPNIAIQAHAVHKRADEGDVFEDLRGTKYELVHKPDPTIPRNWDTLYAVYATAHFAGNEVPEIEVLYREEIELFRRLSRAQNGPWAKWPVQMARVRPLKRLGGRLPISAQLAQALNSDGDVDLDDGMTLEGEFAVEVEADPGTAAKPAPKSRPKPTPKPQTQAQPEPEVEPEPEPGDPGYDAALEAAGQPADESDVVEVEGGAW